jgi:predicted thioesterase
MLFSRGFRVKVRISVRIMLRVCFRVKVRFRVRVRVGGNFIGSSETTRLAVAVKFSLSQEELLQLAVSQDPQSIPPLTH